MIGKQHQMSIGDVLFASMQSDSNKFKRSIESSKVTETMLFDDGDDGQNSYDRTKAL